MEWPAGEEFAPDQSASAGCVPAEPPAGSRRRSLAKEWVGSNRARKERLQLPVATTTEPGVSDLAHHDVWIARREQNGPEFAPRYRYVMAEGERPSLDKHFQERSHRPWDQTTSGVVDSAKFSFARP